MADRARARDRHGRGLRGPLVPAVVTVGAVTSRVPGARSRADRFEAIVLDAVDALEGRWGAQLEQVEFAVEEVPPPLDPEDADVVVDDTAGGSVPLGRLLPGDGAVPARVVVYRRPLEARASDHGELAELVRDVVVDQVARLLQVDPDEVDPPPA